MAKIKKEQEREELHRAIWAIADELRGAVDGWDFKNYVLGTMFYRYISENITNYINEGDELTSLSAIMAAKKGRKAIAGPSYFTYNGEPLVDIAERTQWKNK